MTFSMTIAAVTLVMWVICLGLAPAWIGPFNRSRGTKLHVFLQRSRLLRSRLHPQPTFSLTV